MATRRDRRAAGEVRQERAFTRPMQLAMKAMDERFHVWLDASEELRSRLGSSLMGSMLMQYGFVQLLRAGLKPETIVAAFTHHVQARSGRPFVILPENLTEAERTALDAPSAEDLPNGGGSN